MGVDHLRPQGRPRKLFKSRGMCFLKDDVLGQIPVCVTQTQKLKICLDAPFAKVMGLTSSFAPLTSLQVLSVSINPFHAPGRPPVPLLPYSRTMLPTPRESPVMKAKSVLPQLLDFDQMQTQTCLPKDITEDPSMPLLRDVKRFVRRCLKLSLLGTLFPCSLSGMTFDLDLQNGTERPGEVRGLFPEHKPRPRSASMSLSNMYRQRSRMRSGKLLHEIGIWNNL